MTTASILDCRDNGGRTADRYSVLIRFETDKVSESMCDGAAEYYTRLVSQEPVC